MNLQQIVETLDKELERLARLREIVSGLAGQPAFDAIALAMTTPERAVTTLVDPAPGNGEAGKAGKARARQPRRPREPRARVRPKQPSALTGAIPATPVVVSGDALAREAARSGQRSPAKPRSAAPETGSLGSMIRALRLAPGRESTN